VPVSHLPTEIVMDVEDMVDAALVGFDRRELVTIPSLPDVAQWESIRHGAQGHGPSPLAVDRGRALHGLSGHAMDEHELTRQRLAKGMLLASLRAKPPPGIRVRTDAELDASLEDTLRQHDPAEDLHVFGYGSLMWNPALDVVHTSVALVAGWQRRFCPADALRARVVR
jgi:hypothetical protein